MPVTRRGFLNSCAASGALLLSGCELGTGSEPPVHRARWYLFGTLVDVDIVDSDPDRADRLLAALSADLQRLHHDWHAWKPGRLSDLNQAIARGDGAAVDADLTALIDGVQALHRSSGGAFNPAIGRLVGLWGFHNDRMPHGPLPRSADIERLMADAPSPNDLRVEQGQVQSSNPLVQLDFGGYAKGYALELGLRRLEQAGIGDAILNAGGDLVAVGRHGGRPWRVGVRHPMRPGALAALEVGGREAIFTSGNYERYREFGGKRYAHILDPRSGWPVEEVVSATVVHADAALADAVATAITVAGPRQWHATAAAMGADQVMVVTADGRIELTRRLAERVDILGAVARRVSVV